MKLFSVAVISITGISVASAADLPSRSYMKTPVAPVYDWTGLYLGVNVGVGFGRSLTTLSIPALGDVAEQQRLGDIGGFGGGQIGYNAQFGSWVLGVEADIQAAGLRDNWSCGIVCVQQVATFAQYDQHLDWFGTVRGRIGLADGPVLGYVTGGVAFGGVKTNVSTSVGLASGTINIDETRTGWTIGSGVEAALGGNWTGKIEYLYLDLGSQGGTSALPPAVASQTMSIDIRQHLFRAGLNYSLGGNKIVSTGPRANWAGFYAGGNGGTATALNRSTFVSEAPPLIDSMERFNLSPDGFLGGVQIGYNWQASNWVFGLEADIQGSSQKDDRTCVMQCSPGGFAAFDQRMRWFGTVRGRLGYSVASTLFYGTGGLAYGDVSTRIDHLGFGGGRATPEFSHTRTGWTVGGGLERPFTWLGSNWTVKTEYLFVDLGRSADSYVLESETRTFSTQVREHIFRAGLNYHFNAPVVAKY